MAVFEMNHPLIQHKLSYLRNKNTDTKSFRENLNEIATLMTYEAGKTLPSLTLLRCLICLISYL